MKKILLLLLTLHSSLFTLHSHAQGWPANYGGVMLQGFYWDSYKDSRWTVLESQANELSEYFSLVWIPQSGKAQSSKSMGYDPLYYWNQNSSFGTEAELRSLISTFKSKGIGTIADVVINHRGNATNWVDFPKETYKGVTYQMVSTDICADDDGGATLQWAQQNGYSLSPNKDSGEGWDGMRDLDHSSANVQKIIKAYEDYLLNDLGYAGFRYDVGKGFAARYFGLYNAASKPEFSVGEVWDGNDRIKSWINGTKYDGQQTLSTPQSAAFDFQFRYNVRDAINANDWRKLNSENNLMHDATYQRYAVTFLENHDTEKRKNAPQDPILRDTLAANAYMLSMPGTPCVFYKHWLAYKRDIKKMIAIRKLMGITNQSTYAFKGLDINIVKILINDNLFVFIGPGAAAATRSGWKELTSGYHYKYLVKDNFDTSEWEAIAKHIEETTSDPEPEVFNLPSCATKQSGVYAYFEKPSFWDNTINVWVWGNSTIYPNPEWPGTESQKDVSMVGTNPSTNNSVYLWHYTGSETAPANIIFNDGSNQTDDLVFENGAYYDEDGYRANVETSAIETIETTPASASDAWYTITGTRISRPTSTGIYIHNGKKVMK